MKNLMLVLYAAGLFACTNSRNYAQAVCALVDVIKRGILPKLMPGDSLYVIRIDDESYRKDNVEADLNLDVRPSRANAQKLAFARKLEDFARRPQRARHTDIRGAMMLGAEYLKETGAGTRTLVVFSDMEEDLPKGVKRDLAADEFAGMRVLAMNVKKLNADNANPTAYRARLASWKQQVTSHGAKEFQVVLEPDRLDDLLDRR